MSGSKRLVRAIPVVVTAAGLVVGAVVVAIANRGGFADLGETELHLGPIDVRVVFVRPSPAIVAGGILTAVAFGLLAIGIEAWAARRVTDPARRPSDAARRPLRREATTRPSGELRVTVLVPARNEAQHLPFTLDSLRRQTAPPAAVWVIADNCTDDTAGVARAQGADVYETVDNHHRKGGGLNQLLARLLPEMGPLDLVLVMDADTVMVPAFIERAVAEMVADRSLDAVGGVFFGAEGHGLLAALQQNEFRRYSRDVARRRGRPFVLTGTGSLFRADALAAVAAARGTVLPGTTGDVYDTFSLTEDNELTLALKTLGASMLSPRECRVRTELMPTWPDLWHQRQRWQRGALENLGMYGFSSATARYGGQQLGLAYGVLALGSAFVLSVLSYLAQGLIVVVGFWLVVGALFAVERTATVWSGGWRSRLIAAVIVIELAYAVYLQAVYVDSLLDTALGRSKHWNAAVVERTAG